MKPEKVEKIRERKSYAMWGRLLRAVEEKEPPEILLKMHRERNESYGYGSETRAYYAEESLKQVLMDNGYEHFVLARGLKEVD